MKLSRPEIAPSRLTPTVDLSRLIRKYAGAGPRYTSYPTAVEFSPSFDSAAWSEQLRHPSVQQLGAISLYTHIPFCHSLCYFCACHKEVVRNRAVVAPYLAAVREEVDRSAAILPEGISIEQLHWGGGSPSFLLPEEASSLFSHLKSRFPQFASEADVSIEVDPRTTSHLLLSCYRELGFNRLSLGVQDFDALVQKTINRIQSPEVTADLVNHARGLGFGSINFDLIYGLPEQTPDSLEKTIEIVLELMPDRIALYGYAHVVWLKKVQNSFHRARLPSPEERMELFLLALEKLRTAGYRHIGMDHFARPTDELSRALDSGRLQRNFMGYSTHRTAALIGFGPSAISSLPKCLAQNHKDLLGYQTAASTSGVAIERGVRRTSEDQLRAEVIEQILCRGRIDLSDLGKRWSIDFWEHFSDVKPRLRALEADNLVEIADQSFVVTELGRLFARNIAMVFDEYLDRHRANNRPVFSATV